MLDKNATSSEKDSFDLDDIDREILRILQTDSQLTNVELSSRVGLSPTPCLRRVKRLEEAGYIRSYRADVDRRKLGYPIMAFVQVTLGQHDDHALSGLEEAVREYPEIINCFLITGDCDYMLQVVAKDLDSYSDFVRKRLSTVPSIQHIKSSFALDNVVRNRPIPV